MRCKKHLSDLSSCIGVCASCLCERLIPLTADQLQSPPPLVDRRNSGTNPPPLVPPHSVSPYIARRKVDNAAVTHSDQRFYSTPQVGPTAGTNTKRSKWTLLSNLFRSAFSISSAVSGRRRKQSRLFSVDESTAAVAQRPRRDRGMSPERCSSGEFGDGSAGDFSEGWKETPRRTAQGGRRGHTRSVSGMVLCLSPLVRASPNRQWNQKGMTPETAFAGEIRVSGKPHLANAASFHANRSRKIADFGRFNHNR